MPFIDAVDTYLRYVRIRMATINPERIVRGPMDAQDWPSKEIKFDALYLLVLNEPHIAKPGYSAAVPMYHHLIQWSWAVAGTDINDCTKGRNRGDRFRIDYQIKDELIRATYPGFTDKISLSVVANVLTATPYDPVEPIWWTPIEFGPRRLDKESGVLYGLATTYITQMCETITA